MTDTKTSILIANVIGCAAGGAAIGNLFGHPGSWVGMVAAGIFGAYSDRIAAAEMKWRAERKARKS